jgi:glucose-6-phosphate isomerase
LDTVDLNDYQKQMQRVHGLLAEGGSLVVNCISKSGSTLETLSLAHAVYTDIGEHPRVRFMVTTDTGSKLEALALKQGWLVANLPQMVGGRYSVLSSVGLIPLGFVGISTEEIIEGARDSIHHFLANPTEHPASRVAEILFCAYEEGRNVFEHFFYAKRLESLGKWYRQLLAESVGKIRPDGTHVGVTPTTLIGTTDLHSVAQLQLAHPSDRVLAQVSLRETQDVSYTSQTPFTQLLGDCAKATLPEIMHAANIGNAQAWLSKGGPYISYELESSPRDIGYFLQTKMLEVILLGYMM